MKSEGITKRITIHLEKDTNIKSHCHPSNNLSDNSLKNHKCHSGNTICDIKLIQYMATMDRSPPAAQLHPSKSHITDVTPGSKRGKRFCGAALSTVNQEVD